MVIIIPLLVFKIAVFNFRHSKNQSKQNRNNKNKTMNIIKDFKSRYCPPIGVNITKHDKTE